MAVTLSNADGALKSYYLDAVSEQLNNHVNPFLAMIEKNSDHVYGKDVKQLALHGVNGGISAGTEDGELPTAKATEYTQFVSTLKNLYGVIEISDKAIRASENNSGAFVNLLNQEMESLVKSSQYNFGRMLFGDGSGTLAKIVYVEEGKITVDTPINLMEGMCVDFYDEQGNKIEEHSGRKILSIDRSSNTMRVSGASLADEAMDSGTEIVMKGCRNNEITGLKAIFNTNSASLYGVYRDENKWMEPYVKNAVGNLNEMILQTAFDNIEARSGSAPNVIICSWGVRRSLQKIFDNNNTKIGMMELMGGYKAMTYNGVPIIADRFCPMSTMYLLNTNDFTLHQLCDWQWLSDDDGKVLKQVAGKPVYTATLVKYAELMCSRPNGQGMLSGIVEN